MKKVIVSGIIIITVVSVSTSARIINIPGDYQTIQGGIDGSLNGDTVLVQPNTYYENINFNGYNITVASLFITTGDTSYISSTIIDGDSSGSVVTFDNGEDSAAYITGFTIKNGLGGGSFPHLCGGGITCGDSSNPTITNNIIINNTAQVEGGGIYCRYYSSPTIINNKIMGNSSLGYGGGISCWYYSSPTIGNNTISNNIAQYNGGGILCDHSALSLISSNEIEYNTAPAGGGICCVESSPTIINNSISNNVADMGGGICCAESSPIITNNTINSNIVSYAGGAISCAYASPTITSNIISNNTADNSGGGIYCDQSSSPMISINTISSNTADYGGGICCSEYIATITNNCLSGNSALKGGGIICYSSNSIITNNIISNNFAYWGSGISCEDVSNPIIINTIFWGDSTNYIKEIWSDTSSSPIITFCDIQDTLWPGQGNISIDPLFRDSENGDYHLMATYCGDPYNSPCIDAGHPDILDSLLDCDWGLGGYHSDMGAYGGGDSAQVGISEQQVNIPTQFSLSQNYPNPFNAATTITFGLLRSGNTVLDVYNLAGQRVATLLDGHMEAGRHEIQWDASSYSSGIYFYKLISHGEILTGRMTLLK